MQRISLGAFAIFLIVLVSLPTLSIDTSAMSIAEIPATTTAYSSTVVTDTPDAGRSSLTTTPRPSSTPTSSASQNESGGGGRSLDAMPAATPRSGDASADLAESDPTATATTTATAEPQKDMEHLPVQAAASLFPIGVFEDGNVVGGDVPKFRSMLRDLQSRGLDSVMFTNNFVDRDQPLLDVSDDLGMNLFMMPSGDLFRTWWPTTVPANIETARDVARPVVEQWGPHSSLKGYLLIDEPNTGEKEKIALLTQAFRELDPISPTMPILIGVNRAGPIFDAAQPDVMLINVYPAGANNEACDFTMTGFGYNEFDFISYTRRIVKDKPDEVPLWMILQTHTFGDDNQEWLRQPLPTEIRLQHWLAIGEGATGIFWFIYSSQQGWDGLKDSPELYDEVTALAQRTQPISDKLLGLSKVDDVFTVEGRKDPYISTLASEDGQRQYAVAVNRDCKQPRWLSIDLPGQTGLLRDVETSQLYELGRGIEFQPGDGRMFEVVDPDFVPIILQ